MRIVRILCPGSSRIPKKGNLTPNTFLTISGSNETRNGDADSQHQIDGDVRNSRECRRPISAVTAKNRLHNQPTSLPKGTSGLRSPHEMVTRVIYTVAGSLHHHATTLQHHAAFEAAAFLSPPFRAGHANAIPRQHPSSKNGPRNWRISFHRPCSFSGNRKTCGTSLGPMA